MRVPLGNDKDGNERWAEVTDLDDMPRLVETAITRMTPGLDEKTGKMNFAAFTPALMERMRDTLIAHLVEEWSFDKPLPKGNPDKIQFLPRSAYKALVKATEEHWEEVGFSKGSASEAPAGETSSG